jgi:hypothetical protein
MTIPGNAVIDSNDSYMNLASGTMLSLRRNIDRTILFDKFLFISYPSKTIVTNSLRDMSSLTVLSNCQHEQRVLDGSRLCYILVNNLTLKCYIEYPSVLKRFFEIVPPCDL